MQHVTALMHLHHGHGWMIAGGNLVHSLVMVGIKRLMQGLYGFNPVAFQHLDDLLQHQGNPLSQGAFGLTGRRLQRQKRTR